MNITIPSPIPCIILQGNGWMFALGAISAIIIIIVFWITFYIWPRSRV